VKLNAFFRTSVLTAALVCGAAGSAQAVVVEKVVAVVGERAILLSELRARTRPFLAQIYQKVPPGAQQAQAIDTITRQMLQRMIDDVIERQVADRQHIQITSEEIDAALERLSAMQNLTIDQLIAEAVRSGLTAQEYRDEIRRQLLEGKLLELRVKGRVRVTDEDMRALFAKLQREERTQLGYSLQWIVLNVPAGTPGATAQLRRSLADRIAAEARAGADFAALARKYSDDARTREHGGDLGPQRPGSLEEPIENAAHGLEVGQVSAPFTYADAIVIVRVSARDASRFGTFEDVRDQLAQRVYTEELDKARRKWLDGLKRGMHIDTRL